MQEVLKKLFGDAVTDDTMSTFNAELGKKFVSKADFNTKKDELKTANDTIKNIREELQTLKDSNAGADEWKIKYEELDRKMKDEEKAREAEKADAELTQAIEAVYGDKKFTIYNLHFIHNLFINYLQIVNLCHFLKIDTINFRSFA